MGGVPEPQPTEPAVIDVLPGNQTVIARPGDYLVLGINGTVSRTGMDQIRQTLRNHLPGLAGVAVVERCNVIQVYRP